jgi:hypothetical protein
MRAALLHLDDALMQQAALVGQVAVGGGRDLDFRDLGPALRLWSRPKALGRLGARLRRDLPASAGPALVFLGSGDFHHVTPILLAVLHFDNHPDWVRFNNGAHCGSWVGSAARMPGVARVITVGVCSSDIHRPSPRRADLDLLREGRLELYAYQAWGGAASVELCGRSWPTIEAMGETAFAAFLPSRVETDAIYITIDKDVLRAADAATNWDQGRTSLDFLKALLTPLIKTHRVIGADVVGDWSQAVYGGGPVAALLKRGEAMLDQPHRRPAPQACAANEPVNLDLLALIGGDGR